MKLFELLFGKKEKKNPFAIKADLKPYKKFMIKALTEYFAQEKYNKVFTGAFLGKLCAYFYKTGKRPEVTGIDINAGYSIEEATYILIHAMNICSLKFSSRQCIEHLQKAEVKKIRVIFTRKGKGCTKEQKEKSYKPKADIPLYPCLDCECDPWCLAWYKGIW